MIAVLVAAHWGCTLETCVRRPTRRRPTRSRCRDRDQAGERPVRLCAAGRCCSLRQPRNAVFAGRAGALTGRADGLEDARQRHQLPRAGHDQARGRGAAGVRAARLPADDARRLREYVPFDIDQPELRQFLGFREFFFSAWVIEFVPIAGALAVARRSVPQAAFLATWLAAFFLVKGSSRGRERRDGETRAC